MGPWPPGEGEMARRIREHAWVATPLGPIESWPQSLRTTVDVVLAMPGPAALFWGASSIQLYNDAYIAIAQDRHPGLLGRAVAEGWPDVFEQVIEPLLHAARAGRATRLADIAVVLRGADGRTDERTFDTDWSPVRDESGVVRGALQTLVEATKRRQAERTLRESETRLRLLVTTGSHMVYRMSPDWRVMYQLDGQNILADTREATADWTGKYILPEDRSGVWAAIDAAIAARSLFELEHRVRRANGGVGWVLSRAVPILGPAGEVVEWFGAGIDVTARREMDAALRDSEERHRTLFQTMGQGYCDLELIRDAGGRAIDQRYLELNPAFERLFGIPVAAAKGRRASEVFPEMQAWWHEAFDRIAKGGAPERIENELRPSGRWFEVFVHPRGRDRLTVLYEDVTDRKRAERRLRESEERQAFLLQLSDALRPLNDPANVLSTAARLTGEHLGVTHATYAPIEIEDGVEHYVADYGYAAPDQRSLRGRYRFSDFPGVTEMMRAGRTMVVEDVASDSTLTAQDKASYAASEVSSYVIVPMVKRGRLGAILSAHDRDPRAWSVNEIALLEEIGERTWAALERARAETALRESERTLAADLAGASLLRGLADRLVTEENETTIYEEILAAAIAITEADAGTVQVYDSQTKSLVLLVTNGFDRAMTDRFRRVDANSRTACGMALRTNTRTFIDFDDEADEASVMHVRAGYRAAQATPLVSRSGAPLGMLNTHWREVRRRPNERQLRLLDLLARQAADLIERRQSQEALNEHAARQAYLLKLSDALRPLSDPATVQETACRILGEHLHLDWAHYGRIDPGRRLIINGRDYRRGARPSHAGQYPLDLFPAHAEAWRGGRTLAVDNVASDAALSEGERSAMLAGSVRAALSTALIKDGAPAIVMAALTSAPRQWTATDVALLEATAERAWDAVERAGAETALRRSEARFRQFTDAAPEVVWIRSADTLQWEFLSPAFETIYGLGRDEALKGDNLHNWAALILPEDRETALAGIARVRLGEQVVFEYRVRRPVDGELRWLRNTDFPLRDATGRVERIGGFGQDVTALKLADERLRGIEGRQRALIEGMPQLVWRAVESGRWIWSSPQWSAFTGLTNEVSLGFGWLDAVHPEDRDRTVDLWRGAAQAGVFETNYRLRDARESRHRWFTTRAAPVRDEAGEIVEWLGTSTDIDELRRLQNAQQVMVAELQHRTRNLIAVVRSIARQTMAATGPTEAFREEFDHRLEALARVQGLLSRAETAPITIERVIRMELDALGAPQGISDRIELQGPPVHLRHSIVQTLALALHELATNARKHGALSEDEGRLSIAWRVRQAPGQERRLRVEWSETGSSRAMGEAAERRGYGRELIERALPYSLGAATSYEITPDGVRCTIDLPLDKAERRRRPE